MPQVHQIRVEWAVGDLFEWAPDSHALAHCVGADLRMGADIAVDFREKFGNVAYLLQQGKVPGQVAVLPPEVCARSAPVFYLVTKERSSDRSPTWENFALSVQELRRLCEELKVTHLSMPRIGAGLDHLPWDRVLNLLHNEFQKTSTSVTIFNYFKNSFQVFASQPCYRGFELIGDSNMVRFSVQHATYHQQPRERYPKELGLCVSGQTALGLLVLGLLLQLRKYDCLMPNVVCLIGTNNILSLMMAQQSKNHAVFYQAHFLNLKKHLEKQCQKIIFIPAHPDSKGYIENINKLICGFASENIKVV